VNHAPHVLMMMMIGFEQAYRLAKKKTAKHIKTMSNYQINKTCLHGLASSSHIGDVASYPRDSVFGLCGPWLETREDCRVFLD
jgi:hypothetical protein